MDQEHYLPSNLGNFLSVNVHLCAGFKNIYLRAREKHAKQCHFLQHCCAQYLITFGYPVNI